MRPDPFLDEKLAAPDEREWLCHRCRRRPMSVRPAVRPFCVPCHEELREHARSTAVTFDPDDHPTLNLDDDCALTFAVGDRCTCGLVEPVVQRQIVKSPVIE